MRDAGVEEPTGTTTGVLVGARVAAVAGNQCGFDELLEEAGRPMDRFPDGMDRMWARLAALTDLAPAPSADRSVEPLTERETDVLRLLQGSLSLHEIADELYVSHNTIKTHTRSVYRKLGARSHNEAVRIVRGRHRA